MTLITITPSDVVKVSGSTTKGTLASGVTVVQGKLCTLNSSSEIVLADPSTLALSNSYEILLAASSGSPGQEITLFQKGAVIDIGQTSGHGKALFLQSAGTMSDAYGDYATGEFPVFVGYLNEDFNFVLDPTKFGTDLTSA